MGTVGATDPDLNAPFNTRNFSIASGNTNGAFSINSSTGAITVANLAALNFETTPSFTLTIALSDGGSPALSATNQTVTINVSDVNEAPTITASGPFTVAENSGNGTAVGTMGSSDPDGTAPNNTRNFSIASGNTSGAFTINSSTGAISVANPAALNFEATTSFTLTIALSDGGSPALSATNQTVTINVSDVNEAPAINVGQSFTIAENSVATTPVGNVTSTDPDGTAPNNSRNFSIVGGNTGGAFVINQSSGAISVANPTALNFELTPSFTLTVALTDGGGLAATNQQVVVTVSDVNEAPSIGVGQSFTVAENTAANTQLGAVTSTDPDGTAPNNSRNFSIAGGNTGGAFSINQSNGTISVASTAALNFEATSSFTLTIALADGGGLTASNQTVTITVTDVNEAPTIPANQVFSVLENSSNNTLVGTVGSNDPDQTAPNNSRTFTITGGNTGNAFSINPSNGQISVATSSALNFEDIAVYNLTVEVRDGGNLTGSGTVRVNLQNVNETPTLGAPGSAQPFSKRGKVPTQVFPTITVNDPDGSTDLAKVTITVSLPKAGNGLVQKKVKDLVSFDGASDLGTVSDTRSGTTRTITINLDPTTTSAAVQDFLRGIRFSSSGGSINSKNLSRAFTVRVEDAGGLFVSKSQTVNVVK